MKHNPGRKARRDDARKSLAPDGKPRSIHYRARLHLSIATDEG